MQTYLFIDLNFFFLYASKTESKILIYFILREYNFGVRHQRINFHESLRNLLGLIRISSQCKDLKVRSIKIKNDQMQSII